MLNTLNITFVTVNGEVFLSLRGKSQAKCFKTKDFFPQFLNGKEDIDLLPTERIIVSRALSTLSVEF